MIIPAEQAAANAFANVVMGRLDRELEKKYKMWKSIERESASLQTDLVLLAAATDDQQRAAPRTAVARAYSEEIRELTHEIEDCIERFLHRVTCKAGASRYRRTAHEVRTFRTRLRFATKIKELKDRVREARDRILKAPDGGGHSSNDAAGQQAGCAQGFDPVGIAEATRELRTLLDIQPNEEAEGTSTLSCPARLRVVAVVGFGGSGKTTLAKAVYDSVHEEKTLSCAWVDGRSLDHKDANGILADIYDQLRLGEECSATTSLAGYLKAKENRYLIVIDDIKMKHMIHWNTIRNAFKDNGRIIVTTATQSVANGCSNHHRQEYACSFGHVYNMRTLGEEDSKKIALLGRNLPELELGAKTLLNKCDGLPLALYSVACQLSNENVPTGKFCNSLCRELGTYLEREDDEPNFARLRGVLRDNYTSLCDYTVRTCLLYLGIFPKDRPLKRNVILRRWLAEGYARDLLGRGLSVADGNFKTFIDRCIIQPLLPSSNATEKTCKTHGIMHVFMLHKSMSKKFIMPFGAQHKKVRHLFIHGSNGANSGTPDIDLSRVRSLTVLGNAGVAISDFRKYKIMRVLDLEGCIDVEDRHFECICKLWNLRYLSLGPAVTEITRGIAQLKLLETLDVSKTKVNVLPVEAIGLPCLIHLIGKFKLQDPVKTERLPKACMLETVAGFVVDKGRGFLQLMDHMKKLNKVKIWCDSKETEQGQVHMNHLSKAIQKYIEAPMGADNVRSLSLDFQGLHEGSLSALDQLCKLSSETGNIYHLSSLKLHGNSSTLPKFVALFPYLTELCLSTTVTQDLLSALSEMSCLLYLKLVAKSIVGFVIQDGKFRSLQRLRLVLEVMEPTTLTIEDGARPEIFSLQLICKKLLGLSGVEITRLGELKEIALHPDVPEETKRMWKAEARNHPNRPNVLLIASVDDSTNKATINTVSAEEPPHDDESVEEISARSPGRVEQENTTGSSSDAVKNLTFEPAKRADCYVKGDRLLPEDELKTLGQEAQTLHALYLTKVRDPATFISYIPMEVPDKYHFYKEFGMKKFDINFSDLWSLYNFDRLDSSMIRVWTLYQAKEAKRLKADIGLLDPCIINDIQIHGHRESVIEYIEQAWIHHKDKDVIIMTYNPPDHWVLIVIVVPWNKVFYFDSLMRGVGLLDRDFTLIRRAIDDAFLIYKSKGGGLRCKKGVNNLSHQFKFPCRQQSVGSMTCGFYLCAHMDELVRHHNPYWEEKDLLTLFTGDDYDWKKDFRRIRETFAHFLNNDVLRPSGEFYVGIELPPRPVAP